MSIAIDNPGDVRSGEELDTVRVDAFLKSRIDGLEGSPDITQFAGGASNLTYLVRYADREFVLRRPPFGARAKSAHDMLREARIMTALKPHYRTCGSVRAVRRRCGHGLRLLRHAAHPRHHSAQDLPPGLGLDSAATRTLCRNVIDRLIELHAVDHRRAGLEWIGRGDGYVARQIEGWSERWRRARTDDVGDFEQVIAWLAEKQPAHDIATCVIHNDFRFDNVVLDAANPLEVTVCSTGKWRRSAIR